ncbi:ISAzo13 family transposase, partial [Thermodesulfobacteriota bacterium]
AGLTVHSELDERAYPKGIKVSRKEFKQISIPRHDFHGEWNYTIRPRNP